MVVRVQLDRKVIKDQLGRLVEPGPQAVPDQQDHKEQQVHKVLLVDLQLTPMHKLTH
jgi:hypothetical protein